MEALKKLDCKSLRIVCVFDGGFVWQMAMFLGRQVQEFKKIFFSFVGFLFAFVLIKPQFKPFVTIHLTVLNKDSET